MGFFGADKDKPVKKEVEEAPDKFICAECDTEYDTQEECDKCCPKFTCKKCEEEYDTEEEAKECCKTYACKECEEEHDTQKEADECCIPKFTVNIIIDEDEEDTKINSLSEQEKNILIDEVRKGIEENKILTELRGDKNSRFVRTEDIKSFSWFEEEKE